MGERVVRRGKVLSKDRGGAQKGKSPSAKKRPAIPLAKDRGRCSKVKKRGTGWSSGGDPCKGKGEVSRQ